jgi:hypothetical protein
MWTLLLACATSTPDAPAPVAAPAAPSTPPPAAPDAPPSAENPASVSTLLGRTPGVHFVGDWTSPPCGGRGYARNLHFDVDQGYAGVDLVSPCPVGTTCAWSGLIGYAGLWAQEGDKLKLREIGGATTPGSPHPTEFISTVEGNLVENGCTYTTGLTVPPGYTEDKVRPKVPNK